METKTKNSILIVDDEQANIMTLTHILKPDYTVHAEKTGRGAISTAIEIMPDLILLDILMPDIDGYSVLNSLKADERTKEIPVIFVTGLSDIDSEEKGLSMGAADYIIKPFIPVIVKLRVSNQIELINHMRLLANKEIEEQDNRRKMDFYMQMSHDMLTPMNTIIGMAEIAKNSYDNDEIADCLKDIDEASKELLQLIKKLLKI